MLGDANRRLTPAGSGRKGVGEMTEQERNELRNYAHEIIIKLWEAGEQSSIELLRMHCERALQEPAANRKAGVE